MILSMPEEARALSKVLATDITIVRSDTGVCKDVLIELVAPRRKYFLANRTRRTRFVRSIFMILQLPRRSNDQIAVGTFIALLVQQQVIIEAGLILKFFDAHVTGKLQASHLGSLFVFPFVTV